MDEYPLINSQLVIHHAFFPNVDCHGASKFVRDRLFVESFELLGCRSLAGVATKEDVYISEPVLGTKEFFQSQVDVSQVEAGNPQWGLVFVSNI